MSTIILGIDPGSIVTGFGVIRSQSGSYQYIASGCIKTGQNDLPEKLKIIYENVAEIVNTYCPTEAAIEQVFFHENPNTALKLGQARGTAIAAMATHNVNVAEYSARQIKKTVVGYGAATKDQIQHMVKLLLKINGKIQTDAADGLAIALCHAYTREGLENMKGVARKMRYGRMR